MNAVLRLGESLRFSDTVTIVAENVEDSRCPTGVNCIWAGDAVVTLAMRVANASSSFTLHTNGQFAREIEQNGIRIVLTGVAPHPAADASPRREDYRVSLLIEQK